MSIAQESRTDQRATPRRAERSARPRIETKPVEPQVREWLVDRARERIESGFYEDPLIIEAAIAKAVRQAKPAD